MNRFTLPTVALALGLTLAGCSATTASTTSTTSTGTAATSAGDTSTASATSGTEAAQSVTVTDAWVKAKPDLAGMPMTGVFGTITNHSSAPITITGASSPAAAVTELHETVTTNGQKGMQKIDGGFVIQPGASRELRPGGDHIMLMQMTRPLPAGETVTVTLTTSEGRQIEFEAVAKSHMGGDEKYHSAPATPQTGGTSTPGHGTSGSAAPTATSSAS